MTTTHRIGLLHALEESVAPIEEAFARLWPSAALSHCLEPTLYDDYRRLGGLTAELADHLERLIVQLANEGVDALLVTGSLFGQTVTATRPRLNIPILGAYDGMLDCALAAGSRIVIVATVADTLRLLKDDLVQRSTQKLQIQTCFADGAMQALKQGDRERHDAIIAGAASGALDCDALLLAQFSMAGARSKFASPLREKVLTSPDCAVALLQRLLHVADSG